LARALVGAPTFAAAYAATSTALTEGGIAVRFREMVTKPAKPPEASSSLFPLSVIDLAAEASTRATMASFTLTDFAQMMHELGWPTPAGVAPQDHWVKVLAGWYAAARANIEAPDSFAILFIAAMNQVQSPPANIATGIEEPNHIRLSLLEIELLIAAFDRTRPPPAQPAVRRLAQTSVTPCSDLVKQAGTLGQVGQIGAGEAVGAGIGKGLEAGFGEPLAGKLSNGLSALGTASKVAKLVQHFRYGYIKLGLDTPNPQKKPLNRAAPKQGTLTANAGVDMAKHDEMVMAKGGAELAGQRQAVADCFNSVSLPTPTDVADIAADAENWRVSWSIVTGGGSQVLWSPGQSWDIPLRTENKLKRATQTSATNSVSFDIKPQATDATVGRERTRKAVFKVQLRRGALPDPSTLWGTGKAGAAAALSNPVGAALGIADALTEISTKWALEVASPSAFVTQELIEVEPTGLVGTIRWTITGSAEVDMKNMLSRTVKRASINQNGLIEIVSQTKDRATAHGTETCTQSYANGSEVEQVIEGSEAVGTRTNRSLRSYRASWQTPTTDAAEDAAIVIDGSAAFEGVDPSLLPPELRDQASAVQIILSAASVGCGPYQAVEEEAKIEFEYRSGWIQKAPFYEPSPITVNPELLFGTMLSLKRQPGTKELKGGNTMQRTRQIGELDVPITQTLTWNLRWLD
jgi:hypothetical protein